MHALPAPYGALAVLLLPSPLPSITSDLLRLRNADISNARSLTPFRLSALFIAGNTNTRGVPMVDPLILPPDEFPYAPSLSLRFEPTIPPSRTYSIILPHNI